MIWGQANRQPGDVVEIRISVPEEAHYLGFTLPREAIKAMGETNSTSLYINTGLGGMTQDSKAVAALVKAGR